MYLRPLKWIVCRLLTITICCLESPHISDLVNVAYIMLIFVEFPSWNSILWLTGQSTDIGRPMKPFLLKSQTFGLGQTNWANKFWGIWGIFGQTISTHFDTLSIFNSIIQALFLKSQAFISTTQIFIWDWDLNLNLGCKELVIYPLCVRRPCSCKNKKFSD